MQPKEPNTFERVAAKSGDISDGFIENALDNTLPYGNNFLKLYFDNVPVDSSDIEFATNVSEVIDFRNQLSDLVVDNIRLSSGKPLEEKTAKYVGSRIRAYKEKVVHDKETVATYLKARADGDLGAKFPGDAYMYHGLSVATSTGKNVDLVEGGQVGGVRSNVFMQREIAGLFVHFTSREYLKQRLHGAKPPLEKRIYLNPRVMDSVKIFGDIFSSAEAAGLSIKGKILDRSIESSFMNSRFDTEQRMRGDAIVLYASAEESEALLDVVKQSYKSEPEAFADRKTSRVPRRIGSGIAIGDEPVGVKEESLTSHRTQVMEAVIDVVRTQEKQNPSIDRKKLFRDLWQTAARDAKINPDNMAFNAK